MSAQIKTASHTRGPWTYELDSIERGAEVNNSGGNVCNCFPEDAQLIAAAPDMAEALTECVAAYVAVDHANTYTSDDTLSIVKANERIRAAQDKARSALAKAGL